MAGFFGIDTAGTSSTSTTTVWSNWNILSGQYPYSTTSNITTDSSNGTVWYYWNGQTASGSNCQPTTAPYYTITWNEWNIEQEAQLDLYRQEARSANEIARIQAEADARLAAQRAEQQSRYEKLEKEREEAEKKAKELLLDLIGEAELEVYERTGKLLVKGRQHDYLITKNSGVQRIEKDKVVDLCIHLENRNAYPPTDNVIALKLMVEEDEDVFNEVANEHAQRERGAFQLPECANG